jgi:hypothetical protein
MLARDYNFTEEKFDTNARADASANPLKLTNKFFDCFICMLIFSLSLLFISTSRIGNSEFFENVFNILTRINKSVSKYKVRYESEMRNYDYSGMVLCFIY